MPLYSFFLAASYFSKMLLFPILLSLLASYSQLGRSSSSFSLRGYASPTLPSSPYPKMAVKDEALGLSGNSKVVSDERVIDHHSFGFSA